MNMQALTIGRYIDRGLFVRHDRPKTHNGETLPVEMTVSKFTRGFNSEAERDSYMAVHAALNPEIVAPGDPEDPRKV